jgi:glycerate-2-kinase
MKEQRNNSFLQRIGERKKQCPPWQGNTLAQSTKPNSLKEWIDQLDGLFDYLLSELDPYQRVLHAISFDGKNISCGGREVTLSSEGKVIVVGGGKASHQMAKAVYEIFGERAHGLVASHKDLGQLPPLGNIRFQPAGHPNPDEGSVKGAEEIIRLLQEVGTDDVVFSLISGGGSAMIELPVQGLTLEDYITVNELLNRAGFDIGEWNGVRKHLSQVKGGQLAKRVSRAKQVFNLMVSDVTGNRLDVIASGPFVADSSTFEDAHRTLTSLQQKITPLGQHIPPPVKDYIEANRGMTDQETLKTTPQNVVNLIVVSNNTAIDIAADQLKSKGVQVPEIQRIRNITGDIEDATIDIYTRLLTAVNSAPHKPTVVIAGGEATVDVTRYPDFKDGQSYGGRMQMMAGLIMYLIEDLPIAGLFAATDCRDGKPPAGMPESAGALVSGETLRESRTQKVDPSAYINACNTYAMHEKTGTQIHKATFVTNVMDLAVVVYVPVD